MKAILILIACSAATLCGSDMVLRVVDSNNQPVAGAQVTAIFGGPRQSDGQANSPWSLSRSSDIARRLRSDFITDATGLAMIPVKDGQSVLICGSMLAKLLVSNCITNKPLYFAAGEIPATTSLQLSEGVQLTFRLSTALAEKYAKKHFSSPGVVVGVINERGEFQPATPTENSLWTLVAPVDTSLKASAAGAGIRVGLGGSTASRPGDRALLDLPAYERGTKHELLVEEASDGKL
ncbi:hypothetical protein [Bryobacter aggregatus]|uniref:hypothetical protein n=1 Tax=Bryobacter aggregatus TaxID=360054 RepID=UPI0012BAE4BE|nr:hypothetical protein [Bryobacter aggregatus]